MMRKNLKLLMDRDRKQAGIAILAGCAVLLLFVLVTPLLHSQERAPVVEAPQEEPETPPVNTYANLGIEAKAAVVYDLATGETLYARNGKMQLPLASLTKLLTIYAAAGILGDTSTVTITPEALATEGESGLYVGESFSFYDAARLSLVASSNDATEAIAEAARLVSSTDQKTMLASAAATIPLSQTYAVNGTGLDENTSVSGGYGSAHDVALLAGALLKKKPEIAAATTKSSISVTSKSGIAHSLSNTNQGAVRVPGLLLSKTGFTDLAGGNLVVVFDAGIGHPIAVAVLGSSVSGRFTDVEKLVRATREKLAQESL